MAKIPEQLKAKLDLIDKILRSGSDKKDKKQGKDTKGVDKKGIDKKEFIKWIRTRPSMADAITKNKLMHTKPAKKHAPTGSDAGPWRWGKLPKGYEDTNFKDDQ